jgi:hypothetical protein
MGQPSIPTIKRLFAVSGNRCAFPGCHSALIDPNSGKVIGEICHIKANRAGGPRYDQNQTEEERQGFDNLLILCPNHHEIIDADVEAYTVERLRAMKMKHESAPQPQVEINDDLARQLISNINVGSITDGSVIVSLNQTGGQVAHKITNIGYQPKQIPQDAIPEFLQMMKSVGSLKVHITSNVLDHRTEFLARQLTDLLKQAGWDSSGDSASLYPGLPEGLIFIVPEQVRQEIPLPLDILTKYLKAFGFTNYLISKPDASLTTIVVNAA